VYPIAGWGVAGGLIGARLFHVADHLSYYQQNTLLIPAIWEGGIAVYGTFIGGLVGGFVAAWRSHLDPWPLLDIAAPSMLVGQGIGRLGCLCNGDAWGGDATGCPFCLAIRYTNQNDLLPANLKGVPTYAYPPYDICRSQQAARRSAHHTRGGATMKWEWTHDVGPAHALSDMNASRTVRRSMCGGVTYCELGSAIVRRVEPQGNNDGVGPLHCVPVAGRRHGLTSDLGGLYVHPGPSRPGSRTRAPFRRV